jgi:hypothetical protein
MATVPRIVFASCVIVRAIANTHGAGTTVDHVAVTAPPALQDVTLACPVDQPREPAACGRPTCVVDTSLAKALTDTSSLRRLCGLARPFVLWVAESKDRRGTLKQPESDRASAAGQQRTNKLYCEQIGIGRPQPVAEVGFAQSKSVAPRYYY